MLAKLHRAGVDGGLGTGPAHGTERDLVQGRTTAMRVRGKAPALRGFLLR